MEQAGQLDVLAGSELLWAGILRCPAEAQHLPQLGGEVGRRGGRQAAQRVDKHLPPLSEGAFQEVLDGIEIVVSGQ